MKRPVWYRGYDKRPPFFEGWYFKPVRRQRRAGAFMVKVIVIDSSLGGPPTTTRSGFSKNGTSPAGREKRYV
jgi:hypothetical protein